MRAFIFVFAAAIAAAPALLASADQNDAPHVRAKMIFGRGAADGGVSIPVGIELTMNEGWHTYWKNPGDAGMASSVQWELPPGASAGPLEWPFPKRFALSRAITFGYERSVTLLTHIRLPKGLPAPGVDVSATVRWLECREVCIPGKAKLTARLPAAVGAAEAVKIDQARARIPAPWPKEWSAGAVRSGDHVDLRVSGAGGSARDADFFPDGDNAVGNGAPSVSSGARGETILSLARSPSPDAAKAKTLSGILVLRKESRAVQISVPIGQK